MQAPFRILVIALALGSCGAPGPQQAVPAGETPADAAVGPERGIITGMRPLAAAPMGEQRARMVAQVVRVSSGAGGGGGTMEVVVRLDRGRDVTLVQGSDSGLRIGQRVTVTDGASPRLIHDGS